MGGHWAWRLSRRLAQGRSLSGQPAQAIALPTAQPALLPTAPDTQDTDRDFFMSAQEAVEYGLIDAVVQKPQIALAGVH